jgi:CBS domain containing-hemolysin-like protein
MTLFICIGIVFLAFASAHILSLYSVAVYIDPDDLDDLLPGSSKRRRAMLRKLAGDPRGLVQTATVYRALALVVITFCSFLAVHLTFGATGEVSGYVYAAVIIPIWLSYVIIIEYLPTRRSRRALKSSRGKYLWLVSIVYWLLAPVVRLYRSGFGRTGQDERVTEEEKEDLVERAIETLADQAGISETLVEADEKEMIGQIFLLDQTQVREIMAPRIDIAGIEKSTSFSDIQKLVRADGHSRFPVYEGSIDKIIGILYVKDLFNNMPAPGEEFVITNYLRRPFFVPQSKVIGQLLREFRSRQLHIAIVVDEYGGVAGLVTLEDILEEIVGEIQDEHDSEEADLRRTPDGGLMVDASLRLEKLQDHLETDYDHEEFDTVGGLIYDLVGAVPKEGHRVKWHDIEFEVRKVDGQRIRSVKVVRLPLTRPK